MPIALDKTPSPELEAQFQALAQKWHEATGYMSDIAKAAEHSAHQQIVALGEPVIPLLLHELEKQADHWFIALHSLTSTHPVPQEHRGRVSKMAQHWVEWGRQNGYLT